MSCLLGKIKNHLNPGWNPLIANYDRTGFPGHPLIPDVWGTYLSVR